MKWNKICIMLPTYGRSDMMLPRFINSVIDNADSREQFAICCLVNHKDAATLKYLKDRLKGYDHQIMFENLPSPSLSHYFNTLYYSSTYTAPNIVASMVGDDMEITTKGWDTRILAAVNKYEGMGVFYCAGDDRFNAGLCVNVFLTRQWVEITGQKFMAEKFHGNGIDMVHQLSADATGFGRYLTDVIILHHQWSRKHIGHDETSKRLDPMRKKAIRDKRYEVIYAKRMVDSIRHHFNIDVAPVVSHLQHGLDNRAYVKTSELI